jgi:hypothetical protein
LTFCYTDVILVLFSDVSDYFMEIGKKIMAWHFVRENRRLGYRASNLEVAPGFVYSEPKGELAMCSHGMHASRRVYDALSDAPGPILCRVRCWGDIAEDTDKLVCRHREVLTMRDVSRELRLWACWCIRNTPISNGKTVWSLLTDERSRRAVEVAERFANSRATAEELAAAWAIAWGAAWDARAAAWGAARTAAWDAGDAGATVWAAAREFQSAELERRMLALLGE